MAPSQRSGLCSRPWRHAPALDLHRCGLEGLEFDLSDEGNVRGPASADAN